MPGITGHLQGVNYQGQAWCDMFVDWCFVQAFGKENARELLGGGFSAYTPTSAQYYKNKKQWHAAPQAGDQVFFHNSSRICHTGIVYRVSGNTVYTIEGNTSGASGVIANGGGVCKKSYALGNSRISGYGRPDWSLVTGSGVDVPTTPKGDAVYMFSMKTVKRGETGTHVLLVQEILRARGYKGKDGKVLELDRSCGDNTVYAITAYQRDREKAVSGYLRRCRRCCRGEDPAGSDRALSLSCDGLEIVLSGRRAVCNSLTLQ
ncbi:CHAP domain-containing protein [Lawsonibacter sp. OA9]|uniref:CHAP domain-containing protein n=1 Tax=Lawsonibacter sp. OA9 TaxID=2914163 RepID=UPI001F05F4AC|nr:CHAP domain-containing protein [Lawsonibacter sp. OA9]